MKTIVVVPTFNERENIESLLPALLDLRPTRAVLVVDDNSPDGTADRVDVFCRQFPARVYLHRRAAKLGLGTAYVDGFQRALALNSFNYFVQMDADFSHPPAAIRVLEEHARAADVVIGSRYCPGASLQDWGAGRRGLSQAAAWLVRQTLDLSLCDPVAGFKCFTRRALEQIDFAQVRSRGFAFQIEMNWICFQLGLRLVEVPINFRGRRAGRSKISPQIIWEALQLLRELRRAPVPTAALRTEPLPQPAPDS